MEKCDLDQVHQEEGTGMEDKLPKEIRRSIADLEGQSRGYSTHLCESSEGKGRAKHCAAGRYGS